MRKFGIPLLSAMALLSGCSAHIVETRIADTVGQRAEAKSAHSIFSTDDPVTRTNIDDCPSDLIERVKIKQSFGQKILSLVTLGARDVVTVEVTCKNAETDIGTTSE